MTWHQKVGIANIAQINNLPCWRELSSYIFFPSFPPKNIVLLYSSDVQSPRRCAELIIPVRPESTDAGNRVDARTPVFDRPEDEYELPVASRKPSGKQRAYHSGEECERPAIMLITFHEQQCSTLDLGDLVGLVDYS